MIPTTPQQPKVHRTSTIMPIWQTSKVSTNIEFLTYWMLKDVKELALCFRLRDSKGVLVHFSEQLLDSVKSMTYDCREILKSVGVTGDFIGSVEIEGYSARDLRVPTPAVMARYFGKNFESVVHAYMRTFNHFEEMKKLGKSFDPKNSGVPVIETSETEFYFWLVNGPTAKKNAPLKVEVFNHKGESFVIESKIDLAAYGSQLVYPGRIDSKLQSFLDSKMGWATMEFPFEDCIPYMSAGMQNRATEELTVGHTVAEYRGRSPYLDQELAQSAIPYYMPIQFFKESGLEPTMVFYPPEVECELEFKGFVYGPEGKYLGEINDFPKLSFKSKNLETYTFEKVLAKFSNAVMVDIVAKPVNGLKMPNRLPATVIYGQGTLDAPISEEFKFVAKGNIPALRWGMVSAQENTEQFLVIRNSGFTPEQSATGEDRVKTDVTLYNAKGEARKLGAFVLNPNACLNINLAKEVKDLESFLEQKTGWYTVEANRRSIKTMFLGRNMATKQVSGEHGF